MPDNKWPLLYNNRPAINVNGLDNGLSQNLLSLLVVEEDIGVQHSEATFNNWGLVGSRLDYLFSESDTLDVGKQLEVKLQNLPLFIGFISGLKGMYPQGGPPLLTVEAKNIQRELVKLQDPQGRNIISFVHPLGGHIWTLEYASVREWEVSLESNTNISKGSIEFKSTRLSGHVVAELNPMLHIKDHVILNNIGSQFSGDYFVTGVTQLWDQKKGGCTDFTIERTI